MIIPQFTLRRLLILVAVCALFSLILQRAYVGERWAISVSYCVLFLAVTLGVHAVLFLGIWLASLLLGLMRREPSGTLQQASPFSSPPPPMPAAPPG